MTSDLQRVKIQEMDSADTLESLGEREVSAGEDADELNALLSAARHQQDAFSAARVPRTFEMEMRGRDLVDCCRAGDAVVVVGIVKSVQVCHVVYMNLTVDC
jgi:translation elongation factor EF-G